MATSKRVAANPKLQRIKDYYQYGNIAFLEAVQAIMNMFDSGEIPSDDATYAIRQISRIKLPN